MNNKPASDAAPIHTHFGCVTPQALAFVKSCEFISLGCYCTIASALKILGVRRYAYPFDWLRSPIDGIRHCLQTDFEDFFTYTEAKTDESTGYKVFANTRWGGSFWHHDIDDDVVKQDFARRIDRFLGFGEVPACKPKVFVRILNSTKELDEVLGLMELLRSKFPSAPIFFLVIVDMQENAGPKCLEGVHDSRLLFYFLPTDYVYVSHNRGGRELDHRSLAYARIIAYAVRLWAGGIVENKPLSKFSSIQHLAASCTQWHGGNCGIELFTPRLFKGTVVACKGRSECALPKLLCGREGHLVLDQGEIDRGILTLDVFGTERTFRVPDSAIVGDIMKFKLVKDILTVVLISARRGLPCS